MKKQFHTIIKAPAMGTIAKQSSKKVQKLINKVKAWRQGKPVMLNTGTNGKRVPAKDVWGEPTAPLLLHELPKAKRH